MSCLFEPIHGRFPTNSICDSYPDCVGCSYSDSFEQPKQTSADRMKPEVIGGTWNPKGNFEAIGPTNFEMYECTACGGWISVGGSCGEPEYFKETYKYCPMCGAIMDDE